MMALSLAEKYFEVQLQRIREIRLSERKFYQKITDTYGIILLFQAEICRQS